MTLLNTLLKSQYSYIDYKAFVNRENHIVFVYFDKNFPFSLELGDRLELISGNLNITSNQVFSFRIKTQNDNVSYQNFIFVVLDQNNNVIYQESFPRSQANNRIVTFIATPPINVVLYNENLEVLHTSQDIYMNFVPLNQNLYSLVYYGQQTYKFPIFLTERNLPEIVFYYRTKNSLNAANIPVNAVLDFSIYYKENIVGIYQEETFLSDYKYPLSYAFLESNDPQNSMKFLSPFTVLLYKNLRDLYLYKISDLPEIRDFNIQSLPLSGPYLYERYVFDAINKTYLPKNNALDVLETLLFSYLFYKFPNFSSTNLSSFLNTFINAIINFVPSGFYPGNSVNGKHIVPNKILGNNNESYYLGTNLLLLDLLNILGNTSVANLLKDEIQDKFLNQNIVKINTNQTNLLDLAIISSLLPKYFANHANFANTNSLVLNDLNNAVFDVTQIQANSNVYSSQFNPEINLSFSPPISLYSKNIWEDLLIKYFLFLDFSEIKSISHNELILGFLEFDRNNEKFISPSIKASLLFNFLNLTKQQDLNIGFSEEASPQIIFQSHKVINNILTYEVEFDKPTKAVFLLTHGQNVIKYSHSSHKKYNHVFIVDISGINNIYAYNFVVFPVV